MGGPSPLAAAAVVAGLAALGACSSSTEPRNESPSATIAAPAEGSVFARGEEISFQGSASDPEAGSLSGNALVWSSDRDGQLGTGVSIVRDDLSAGGHRITLTARDPGGATGTASVSITVDANAPPAVTIEAPADGATFTRGAEIEFRGGAEDPEEGELSGDALTWSSDRDGELGTGGALSRDDLSAGTHQVTLTAADVHGVTGTATVSVTVEENAPPVVEITSPEDGGFVIAGDEVPFEGAAEDPEEGSLSGDALAWSSDRDGELGTGLSFSRSDLSIGTHVILLTATDAMGAEGTASASLTVGAANNQAPTASIDAPAPGAVFDAGAAVTLEATVEDPEQGTLPTEAVVWTSDRDGELGRGSSITVTDFSTGSHTITLTATDANGAEDADQIEIAVYTPSDPVRFRIRLAVEGDPTSTQLAAFREARDRWEAAITGDLFDEIVAARDLPSFLRACLPQDFDDRIDDLLILARFEDIDGPGGVLGRAGPCGFRDASLLPVFGVMEFDQADLEMLGQVGLLDEVIVHEMGHVLGFGVIWDFKGLLELAADPLDGNTRTLGATADATLSAHFPDTNFGTPNETDAAAEHLAVGANLGVWTSAPDDDVVRSLVRFDLSDVPPDIPYDRSILRLQVDRIAGTASREIEVGRVTSAWSETEVTWNGRPSVASPPVATYASQSCDDRCRLDVSGVVEAWLSGASANHGLSLFAPAAETTADFTVGYESRHAGNATHRPRLTLIPDTHFDGPAAVAAFDAAGGASFEGEKVPVENDVTGFGPGSLDSHWRESVFFHELMTPAINGNLENPLSEVSIAAMEDLGYTVEPGAADAYSLPSGGSVLSGGEGSDRSAVWLVDDVRRGPMAVLGRDGRVRRIIRRVH